MIYSNGLTGIIHIRLKPPFAEFVAVMSRKVNASYTPDQVKKAFKIFEKNAPPGYIRAKDLQEALIQYSTETVNKEQAQELLAQLGADQDGLINYVEYVNMMMSE